MNQKKDQRQMAWAEVAREAEIIQRDFEQALAEWYLFAPDDAVLDPGIQKNCTIYCTSIF